MNRREFLKTVTAGGAAALGCGLAYSRQATKLKSRRFTLEEWEAAKRREADCAKQYEDMLNWYIRKHWQGVVQVRDLGAAVEITQDVNCLPYFHVIPAKDFYV